MGAVQAPRPARSRRTVRFHAQRGSGGSCETGYGAVDERAGRGAQPHDGRARLARCSVFVRSLTGTLPCSSDRAKRVSEEVGRGWVPALVVVVGQSIVVLVALRRMCRSLDGEPAAAQLENGAPERMADAAYQFFGGMDGAVGKRFEELVRFGQAFANRRISLRHS